MVCLDTSFIIDLLNGKEEVKQKMHELEKSSSTISIASPSIMELINGANLSSKESKEKEKIIRFLSGLIVHNFTKTCGFIAGDMQAYLTKKGNMIDIEDIMIASIAIDNKEVLLTGNKKHFQRVNGLRIETY